MEWVSLGWRDAVLLLVAVAAIYLMLMLLKLIQVGRRHGSHEPADAQVGEEPVDTTSPLRRRVESDNEPGLSAPPALSSAAAVSAYEAEAAMEANEEVVEGVGRGPFAVPPAPTFAWDDVKELFGDDKEQETAAPTPTNAASSRGGGFGEHLAEHLARTDVETEMQRMRDEMERMRKEMEDLRAARRVSPQYAEAMELMRRGLTPQDVADQLGISLAEAELVHALGRGRQNFDEGEDNGADGYATYTGNERRAG